MTDDDGEYALLYGGGNSDESGFEDVICSIEGLTAGLHEAFPAYFPQVAELIFPEFPEPR